MRTLRIQDIITGFIDTWYAKGGELFNWYTLGARSFDTPYGAYSIADDVTQFGEPKELAYTSVRDEMNGLDVSPTSET